MGVVYVLLGLVLFCGGLLGMLFLVRFVIFVAEVVFDFLSGG